MYAALSLYPVEPGREAALADVFARVSRVALRHGALADASFAPSGETTDERNYGLVGLDRIAAPAGTHWWFGLMLYRDRAHYDDVMAAFDADPETAVLYEEFAGLIDPGSCLRGEFTKVAGSFAFD